MIGFLDFLSFMVPFMVVANLIMAVTIFFLMAGMCKDILHRISMLESEVIISKTTLHTQVERHFDTIEERMVDLWDSYHAMEDIMKLEREEALKEKAAPNKWENIKGVFKTRREVTKSKSRKERSE